MAEDVNGAEKNLEFAVHETELVAEQHRALHSATINTRVTLDLRRGFARASARLE